MKISATSNLTNSRIYFGKTKYFIEPGMVNVIIPDDGVSKEYAEFYASTKGGKLIKIEGARKRRAPAKKKAPAKKANASE